ncbi:36834_t:CDS:2 [Gigaspora margarita]|uniref:36834_t:CDS:1 n=1 Tax=Gigaspora margarita TaxID=4874 RepID=A0ABN7V3P8_GIGMA|nr:36834_t:CDS:2 [Gigaspora margarita]
MHISVCLIKAQIFRLLFQHSEYQAQQAIDFENNNNDDNSDKENTSISIKLKNLLKVFTKGRPKLSAHRNNNIVNQQKAKDLTHDKQRRDYYCSYCKNKEHNIATCPEKDKDT